MTIGESISKHRRSLGLSQEALGKILLVSRQTVSLWEKNQTMPTIDNLLRLKEVFGITVDEILCADAEEKNKTNSTSLDSICASLAYAMRIAPPKAAAEKNPELSNYIDRIFGEECVDRVVMYNPDAIAQWVYEKYPGYLEGVIKRTDVEVFLAAPTPPITPVCLATMYSGVQPEIHGIQKYEKPVLSIETIFDALIAAGKRPALISYKKCSLSRLFLERNMDYFHFPNGDITETVAKACELIIRDEHDFIVIYNGNYDSVVHKNGPESARALAEIRVNDHIFSVISELINSNWKHHNTLLGFAVHHGCHEIEGNCGSHGLDMPEDVNIVHLYKGYTAKK